MNKRTKFTCSFLWKLLCALALPATGCLAGNYTNFDVAIYIPVGAVRSFESPKTLTNDWNRISRQLKVDKVYIEVQRNRDLAGDELLERVKKFFLDRGVRVAGGMALSDGGIGGQFRSFCYTDPADREFIKNAAELAARHFDEIIQDDFFFVTTKNDSDIAAKGNEELDAIPAGTDARRRGKPDGQAGQGGESQGQDGHQIPQLVRAFPGSGL